MGRGLIPGWSPVRVLYRRAGFTDRCRVCTPEGYAMIIRIISIAIAIAVALWIVRSCGVM